MKRFMWTSFAVSVLLFGGGILASNAGFKITYLLKATGEGSASGKNYLALPFTPKPGLESARDLFQDIGVENALQINRYRTVDGNFEVYTMGGGTLPPNGWNLAPGEAVIVTVLNDTPYRILGSHPNGGQITLLGAEHPNSEDGTNYVAIPYHSVATTARELFQEIGGTILAINRHRRSDDGFDVYASGGGTLPPNGWNLQRGEGYIVKVLGSSQIYRPSHY